MYLFIVHVAINIDNTRQFIIDDQYLSSCNGIFYYVDNIEYFFKKYDTNHINELICCWLRNLFFDNIVENLFFYKPNGWYVRKICNIDKNNNAAFVDFNQKLNKNDFDTILKHTINDFCYQTMHQNFEMQIRSKIISKNTIKT